MARWQPGAPERLQAAALKRFAEQGYDGTTVAEIAATAGLTERTFFRYFADKREVLFYGREAFERVFIEGIEKSQGGNALAIVADALLCAGEFFGDDRRERSRARSAVIASDPSLQERELLKLSALAESMADALRARGINATAATLAAESGVAAFRVAYTSWIADGERRSLSECQAEALIELRALLTQAG